MLGNYVNLENLKRFKEKITTMFSSVKYQSIHQSEVNLDDALFVISQDDTSVTVGNYQEWLDSKK